MKKQMKAVLFQAAVLSFLGGAAEAHPGKLDEHGCHVDPASNEYHCHQAVQNTQTGAQPATKAEPEPAVSTPVAGNTVGTDNAHLNYLGFKLGYWSYTDSAEGPDSEYDGLALCLIEYERIVEDHFGVSVGLGGTSNTLWDPLTIGTV